MAKREQAPKPPPPPRGEDGDTLTEEDEEILDKVLAAIPDEVKAASDKWVMDWANEQQERKREGK